MQFPLVTASVGTRYKLLVISSGARDLAFFSYMRRKISRPELILSEVEELEMTIATRSPCGEEKVGRSLRHKGDRSFGDPYWTL